MIRINRLIAAVLWPLACVQLAAAAGAVPAVPGRSFERAMIIPVEGEINNITADSVGRRLARAQAENVPLIVFQMNTPGGAIGPTLKICSQIKQLRGLGVKTYAWIDNEAYSAGTMIALATDGIVMAPNATMGDCQPIMSGEFGPVAVPTELEAKIVSPVLTEMRDSAHRNGYSVELVTSMVRPDSKVFWVANSQTQERRFVDLAGRDQLFGWSVVRSRTTASGPADSDAEKPTGPEPLPDAESRTAWRYVHQDPLLGEVQQPIVRAHELLTMKDERAKAFGFSLGAVANESELRSFLGITGDIEHTNLTWVETIVEWLAMPAVRALLFVVIVLGIYAEFHAPGVGVPGAIALGALILFLGAPYMTGFTVTWEIVVIFLGLVLLALEIFVIPGFGVVGIAGLILLGFGLLSSFAPPEPFRRHWFDLPQLPMTYRHIRQGLAALTGGLVGSVAGMMLLGRYLPRAPIMNRIIAKNPTREDVVVDDPYQGIAKIGDIGRTETMLRPAGKVRFGAMLVDVVSQGDYIAAGEKVEVIERCGNRVVVRRARD